MIEEPQGPDGAIIRGDYRYLLWRAVPGVVYPGTLLTCMLNPSSADAKKNDPTLTRCLGFAEAFGFARLEVVNAAAWRSHEPEDLKARRLEGRDVVGPENDAYVAAAVARADLIVCAWGGRWRGNLALDPAIYFRPLLGGRGAYCLGRTQKGDPRHPLYLKGATPLESFYEPRPP